VYLPGIYLKKIRPKVKTGKYTVYLKVSLHGKSHVEASQTKNRRETYRAAIVSTRDVVAANVGSCKRILF